MSGVSWILCALASLAFCVATVLWIGTPSSPPGRRQESQVAEKQSQVQIMPPKRVDIPAIEDPSLEFADEVRLEDEAIVIGVVVNGEPRAYLRRAFEGPLRHVVTDVIDSMPVAITHCDLLRCTRVFTGPELDESRNIRMGGWRADQTMALIVSEREYSQKAIEIPLAEVPYLELPWGMWRELFPETLVYTGQRGAG